MTTKWGFRAAMLPVGALCFYRARFGHTLLPKWPFWAHLFHSVFYNLSELRRACFRQVRVARAMLLPAALFRAGRFLPVPPNPTCVCSHIWGFPKANRQNSPRQERSVPNKSATSCDGMIFRCGYGTKTEAAHFPSPDLVSNMPCFCQEVQNPTPLNLTPCNMPQVKTEVALQFSESCAAEVALQHSLFCSAKIIFTKSCAATNAQLQCSIEKAALQESSAFLPLSCGFQAPTFRHPRLGPADFVSERSTISFTALLQFSLRSTYQSDFLLRRPRNSLLSSFLPVLLPSFLPSFLPCFLLSIQPNPSSSSSSSSSSCFFSSSFSSSFSLSLSISLSLSQEQTKGSLRKARFP